MNIKNLDLNPKGIEMNIDTDRYIVSEKVMNELEQYINKTVYITYENSIKKCIVDYITDSIIVVTVNRKYQTSYSIQSYILKEIKIELCENINDNIIDDFISIIKNEIFNDCFDIVYDYHKGCFKGKVEKDEINHDKHDHNFKWICRNEILKTNIFNQLNKYRFYASNQEIFNYCLEVIYFGLQKYKLKDIENEIEIWYWIRDNFNIKTNEIELEQIKTKLFNYIVKLLNIKLWEFINDNIIRIRKTENGKTTFEYVKVLFNYQCKNFIDDNGDIENEINIVANENGLHYQYKDYKKSRLMIWFESNKDNILTDNELKYLEAKGYSDIDDYSKVNLSKTLGKTRQNLYDYDKRISDKIMNAWNQYNKILGNEIYNQYKTNKNRIKNCLDDLDSTDKQEYNIHTVDFVRQYADSEFMWDILYDYITKDSRKLLFNKYLVYEFIGYDGNDFQERLLDYDEVECNYKTNLMINNIIYGMEYYINNKKYRIVPLEEQIIKINYLYMDGVIYKNTINPERKANYDNFLMEFLDNNLVSIWKPHIWNDYILKNDNDKKEITKYIKIDDVDILYKFESKYRMSADKKFIVKYFFPNGVECKR